MSISPAGQSRTLTAPSATFAHRLPVSNRSAPEPHLTVDRIDQAAHGFGVGFLGGASIEAGLGGGLGATAAAGAGMFYDRLRGVHPGTFAAAGAFAGAGHAAHKTAAGGHAVAAFGAFAGAGFGAFITNAASANALAGVAQTYSLNLGIGPLKGSLQVAVAGDTYVGAVTVGPGIGLDASRYPTRGAARSY